MNFLITIILFSFSAWGQQKTELISGSSINGSKKLEWILKDHLGTFVIFLSAKCPCSHSHLEELRSLAKEYPKINFLAIHSNKDESVEFTQSYFEKNTLPFPILQDKENHWANHFKALKTPHAFLLNSQGEIVYQGGVSSSRQFSEAETKYAREALEDFMAQRKIRTPEGRTLGCSIPRGDFHE